MRAVGFIAAVFVPAVALGAPLSFTHSGRLLDTLGQPIDGQATVEVVLHTDPSADTDDYIAQFPSLDVDNGYYAVQIGGPGTPALDPALLAQQELYLAVSVDGTEVVPRTRILGVPYAVRSHTSENLVGAESCSDGETARWNASAGTWECGLQLPRRTCPVGMVLVDTAGPLDRFCISTGFATTAGWRTPTASAAYCESQGWRQCTIPEFRSWCVAGKPGQVGDERFYLNAFSGPDPNSNTTRVASAHCTYTGYTWPNLYWDDRNDTEVRNVRCCIR